MVGIVNKPDTFEKLRILSEDSQYDLACACGTNKSGHRKRSDSGRWIYPVTLPDGGTSTLFKTLISNACSNDCKYCPLRNNMDVRRCTLSPDETASVFMDYYNRGEVFGLFLSSGLLGNADTTMQRLIDTAKIVRYKHDFKGYIHLKVLPGSSKEAIQQAVSLSSAVSLNIETPGAEYLEKLSGKKDYIKDIIEPIKFISDLTAKGSRFHRVKQTTQFIVGAAGENDQRIVKYMWGLYDRLKMHRVYFSAYQRGLGDPALPGETITEQPHELLNREHRLYQVDYLFRKYGFKEDEIAYDPNGSLCAATDPKQAWADANPQRFPVHINKASKLELLRVPGLGPISVSRILKRRTQNPLGGIEDIGRPNALLMKAKNYIAF